VKTLGNALALWIVMNACNFSVYATEPVERPTWQAGTAKAVITPESSVWLAGYGSRTKPAEGKLHDLWVKVLAVEDATGRKAVVVTTDLLGIPRSLGTAVCEQIETQCGLPRSQIMLTSSHTHSGPVLSDSLTTVYPMDETQRAASDQYTHALEQAIVKSVAEAIARLSSATVAVGSGTCDFAVNRRNNVEKDVVQLLAEHQPLKGPVDHSVPVLAVHNAEGHLLALLFLYACHNTTLYGYEYSGDYAGFAQIAVEEKHPEALAMFAMGCGADQNPLPRRSVELCRKYGDALAAGAEAVLAQPMQAVAPSLHAEFETIDLPFSGELHAETLQSDAGKDDYLGRGARSALQQMADLKAQGKELPKSYPYPVQVWRLGDNVLWIALGGEVVVDYALDLKTRYGEATWVFGYANDVMAYIPSNRIWKEGGYESGAFNVYNMLAERWCPDIETRIDAAVEQLVSRIRIGP
jgi:neutral ceramidase